MPTRARRPCPWASCPNLTDGGWCTEHAKLYEKRRGSSSQRGYDDRWRKYRAAFLARHPWCLECLRQGRRTLATVVDHVQPHRGNDALMWNPSNHASMCARCHNRKTVKHDGGRRQA
jgi:5-methylcytosine-specific restriction enzyme A